MDFIKAMVRLRDWMINEFIVAAYVAFLKRASSRLAMPGVNPIEGSR